MRQHLSAIRQLEGVRIAVVASHTGDLIGIADSLDREGAILIPLNVAQARWAESGDQDLVLVDLRGQGSEDKLGPELVSLSRRQRVVALIDTPSTLPGFMDFVLAPVRREEVVARLCRALDRPSPAAAIRAGNLTIDLPTRIVKIGERTVDLTMHEFDILHELAAADGAVRSRDALARQMGQFAAMGRAIDIHVHRLRAKLEGLVGAELVTVRGVGYRLTRR